MMNDKNKGQSSIIINNELSLYQSDLAITGLFAVSFN